MSQAGSIVVTLRGKENLSLVFQATKCLAMQDSIPVNLENRSDGTGFFIGHPPPGGPTMAGMITENVFFSRFNNLSYNHLSSPKRNRHIKSKALVLTVKVKLSF
jgi:hypothetical protein